MQKSPDQQQNSSEPADLAPQQPGARKHSRARMFVPLAVFGAIVLVAFVGFYLGDPQKLPSALLNKPFPEFRAKTLLDPQREVSREDLLGRVVLVNVWATWCPTCLLYTSPSPRDRG